MHVLLLLPRLHVFTIIVSNRNNMPITIQYTIFYWGVMNKRPINRIKIKMAASRLWISDKIIPTCYAHGTLLKTNSRKKKDWGKPMTYIYSGDITPFRNVSPLLSFGWGLIQCLVSWLCKNVLYAFLWNTPVLKLSSYSTTPTLWTHILYRWLEIWYIW